MTEQQLQAVRDRLGRNQAARARRGPLRANDAPDFIEAALGDVAGLLRLVEEQELVIRDLTMESAAFLRGKTSDRRRSRDVVNRLYEERRDLAREGEARDALTLFSAALLERLAEPMDDPLPYERLRDENARLRFGLRRVGDMVPRDGEGMGDYAERVQRHALAVASG